jgi:hypothetical protein
MSENFNVKAQYDLTELDRQEATEIQPRLQRLNNQIHQTEMNMERVVRRSFSAINATMTVARMMANSLGDAFPPIFNAIFTAITQTVYSLQSMAAAYAAGVVTAPLTAVLEMAAISLSIAAIGYTAMGQQQVAQEMQRVQSALSGVGRMGRHYGGVYESWQNT